MRRIYRTPETIRDYMRSSNITLSSHVTSISRLSFNDMTGRQLVVNVKVKTTDEYRDHLFKIILNDDWLQFNDPDQSDTPTDIAQTVLHYINN